MCSRFPDFSRASYVHRGSEESTAHYWGLHISHKMLSSTFYDGQGFWLAQKRLSKGRFQWWPTGKQAARVLEAHQAQLLLAAGNPETAAAPVWRRVSAF